MSKSIQTMETQRQVAVIGLRRDASQVLEAVNRSGLKVPTETMRKLERLEEYDLSFVTDKFSNQNISIEHMAEQAYMVHALVGRLDDNVAKSLELDFKRWIAISILYPGEAIAPPSRAVDMYWHLAILHSKEYREFCTDVLGRYMGHAPATEESQPNIDGVATVTKSRFTNIFGAAAMTNLLYGNNNCSGGYCTSNCSGSDCSSGNCKSDCQASI